MLSRKVKQKVIWNAVWDKKIFPRGQGKAFAQDSKKRGSQQIPGGKMPQAEGRARANALGQEGHGFPAAAGKVICERTERKVE